MSSLLLDTHSLLWFASDDGRLPRFAYDAILDSGSQVTISIASIWELAIKVQLKKIQLDDSLEVFVDRETEGFLGGAGS